jgi:hypothetical protein
MNFKNTPIDVNFNIVEYYLMIKFILFLSQITIFFLKS